MKTSLFIGQNEIKRMKTWQSYNKEWHIDKTSIQRVGKQMNERMNK